MALSVVSAAVLYVTPRAVSGLAPAPSAPRSVKLPVPPFVTTNDLTRTRTWLVAVNPVTITAWDSLALGGVAEPHGGAPARGEEADLKAARSTYPDRSSVSMAIVTVAVQKFVPLASTTT